MGYRPDDQSIQDPINIILKGFDNGLVPLFSAIIKRAESGEWRESHIQEMRNVHIQLVDLKLKLAKLSESNW